MKHIKILILKYFFKKTYMKKIIPYIKRKFKIKKNYLKYIFINNVICFSSKNIC